MFRRRPRKEASDPVEPELPSAQDQPAPARTEGPWDVTDEPADDVPRLDLGGLRVPATAEVELRLEADPSGTVAGVILVHGASTLAVGAFAAPRQQGIWDDVRADLLQTLRTEGSGGREREGPFGTELSATVAGPDGPQAARFVGVDGPCWFVRGMFTGPAATDPVQARVLEGALRQIVVSRGDGALPVRGPLPLALPHEVMDQAAADTVEPAPGMPQRGPEITEIR